MGTNQATFGDELVPPPKLAPRHKPPRRDTARRGGGFFNNTFKAEAKRSMKKIIKFYAAFIAGVLAAAGMAYWYYVQHLEDGDE